MPIRSNRARVPQAEDRNSGLAGHQLLQRHMCLVFSLYVRVDGVPSTCAGPPLAIITMCINVSP